jgi:hypothetical protein
MWRGGRLDEPPLLAVVQIEQAAHPTRLPAQLDIAESVVLRMRYVSRGRPGWEGAESHQQRHAVAVGEEPLPRFYRQLLHRKLSGG